MPNRLIRIALILLLFPPILSAIGGGLERNDTRAIIDALLAGPAVVAERNSRLAPVSS